MVSLLVICTKFAPLSLTALHNFPSRLDDWVLEAIRQCQALPRSSIPEIYQDVRACYRHMFSLGAMKIADIGGTFQHHAPLAMLFRHHSDFKPQQPLPPG